MKMFVKFLLALALVLTLAMCGTAWAQNFTPQGRTVFYGETTQTQKMILTRGLGSELVSNGDFSTSYTGWTLAGDASVVDGVLVVTDQTTTLDQDVSVETDGALYVVSFDITLEDNLELFVEMFGGTQIGFNGDAAGSYDGTHRYIVRPADNNLEFFWLGDEMEGTLDNVSVKPVQEVIAHEYFGVDSGGQISFDTLMHREATTNGWARGAMALTSATLAGEYPAALGGYGHTVTGSYAGALSGSGNDATASYSVVAGGGGNVASGAYATVGGGGGNIASSNNATVGGGGGNVAGGNYVTIAGGGGNEARGNYNTIIGGSSNDILDSIYSTAGGLSNIINDAYAAWNFSDLSRVQGLTAGIFAGGHNAILDSGEDIDGTPLNSLVNDSVILGGTRLRITDSERAAMIGGSLANITDSDYTIVLGSEAVDITTSPNSLIFWNNTSSTTDTINISDAVIFGENVKMGINTVSPENRLQVMDSNSADATPIAQLRQTGTFDSSIRLRIPATSWTFGIDNSDSDSFKIENATALGGATPAFVLTTGGSLTVYGSNPSIGLDSTSNPVWNWQVVDASNTLRALHSGTVPISISTTGITVTGLTATGNATFSGGIIMASSAPANASATGVAGQYFVDATHVYYCTATNTWIRQPHSMATW